MLGETRELWSGHACGKVILLGEHAVVYGVPALAVGIDRGVRARAIARGQGPSTLRVRGWEIEVHEDEATKDLGRALRALLDVERGAAFSGRSVSIEAEVDL